MVWRVSSGSAWAGVLLLAVLVFPAFPISDAHAETTDDCSIEDVPGIGPACLRDDGLFEVFASDGTSLGRTHGADAPPPSDEGLLPTGARPPACVQDEDEGYFARVIYAWASDRTPSRTDGQIRSLVHSANGIVYDEAATMGGQRDLRVLCTPGGKVDVLRAGLATRLPDTSFSTVVDDLKARGNDDTRVHYWVFFEDKIACGCAGIGHVGNDGSHGVTNSNNGGGLRYAVTFGYMSTRVMLHELSHNNGAVQHLSPNSSGGFHCNDGRDIMCYSDGGSKSHYDPNVCSWQQFDCNNDDYFHLAPASGSYLSYAWNLGHVNNRFMRGCMEATGILEVGLGGVGVNGPLSSLARIDVPPGCHGRPFILEGWLPRTTVAGATLQPAADVDVCWYDGNVQMGCHTGISREFGTVPAGADEARIVLKSGAQASYFLRVG